MNWEDHNPIEWQAATRSARWYEWLLVLLLLALAAGVRAESVYKCTDADSGIAYQAQPCATRQQTQLIELAPAPAYARSPEYAVDRTPPPRVRTTYEQRREPPSMSFECRTADGQVFYRHAACPHSVAASTSSTGSASRRGSHGSGASVSVSSSRIPRDEACRQIHAAGSIGRAGRQHDEDVSTYERNLGRDPCR